MSPQDASHLPAIIPSNGVDTYRMSTDAATVCRALVLATAMNIQGRKYVRAEGWQAIAVAHGCAASACDVQRVDGGFRATGQVRRMDTGAVIAEAEGFVGEDEPVWFGGTARGKTHTKRPDFAIRAMAQTRAISRACRSAFAHVVVQIDKNLGTTPAEEMQGVYDHESGVDDHQPQGWAGSTGEVDEADRGLIQKGPTAGQLTRIKKWLEGAHGTLKLTGQTPETLGGFRKDNATKFKWVEDNMPEEHKALEAAYTEALDAAQARMPNTMQAG